MVSSGGGEELYDMERCWKAMGGNEWFLTFSRVRMAFDKLHCIVSGASWNHTT